MSLRAFALSFGQAALPGIRMGFQRANERAEDRRIEEREDTLRGEERKYQKEVLGEQRTYAETVRAKKITREDKILREAAIKTELHAARRPEDVDKIWGSLSKEEQDKNRLLYESAIGNATRFKEKDDREAELQEQQLDQGRTEKEARDASKAAREELYTGTGPITSVSGIEMARAAWNDAKNSGDTEVAGRLAGRLGPEFVKETEKYFKRANDARMSQLMLDNPEKFTRGVRIKHALQAEPGTGGNAIAAQARSEGVLGDRSRRESLLLMVTEQEFAARAEAQKYGEERVPKTEEQLMEEVRGHFKVFKTIELDGDVESAIESAWANNVDARGGATVAREVVAGTIRIMQERGRVKLTPPVRAMIEKKVLEMMEPPKDETATPEAEAVKSGGPPVFGAPRTQAEWSDVAPFGGTKVKQTGPERPFQGVGAGF